MRAAVLHGPGDLRVEERPVPALDRGDLLVRVRAASVCGTDLRIHAHGHFKLPVGTPRVLGHEIAGDVVEIRGETAGFAVGDRVSVTPNVGCGRCDSCAAGLNNMCPDYEAFGITLDGGFQEYLRVPAFAVQRGNVFRLPATVSYRDAALTEPFSCCYRGQRAVGVGFEDVVVIIGAGPIGIYHTVLARLAGARRVIVSNSSADRLAAARVAGADQVVDTSASDLAAVVAEQTDGRGADVVLVTASSPQAQAEGLSLLATHGRLNVFAGISVGGDAVPLDTNRVHYRGLTVTGTTGSSNLDYRASLRLVADGRVRPGELITAGFGLDQVTEALAHARDRRGMKAIIEPHGTTTSTDTSTDTSTSSRRS